MPLVTEYPFSLPKGYIDPEGNLHRHGIMRLATAADEILPMRDPRVQQNPAYLTIILLSRVMTQLGELRVINPAVIEGLFSSDLAYLQEFYRHINETGTPDRQIECPKCTHQFQMEMESQGEAS